MRNPIDLQLYGSAIIITIAEKHMPDMDSFACPMVYPFMMKNDRYLRNELISNKVFVARYWPNVKKQDGYETEYDLAMNVIPIPCDQRYGKEEMDRIVELINISIRYE